ncbi:HAMP domain-containing sensor histidine kinase, partial [Microbacterium flavum]|uniref:sensor histidine kinase n=1 Tax=Microbacterium flavum TaxID=415216 RepID=UPI0031DC2157
MGFSEAMREEVLGALGNRRYKDYASHIHASGRRLLTLADELMLISQGEAGSLSLREEPVDVGEMVSSLLAYKKTAAEKAGLTLASYIASGLPKLNADKAKLRQMLRHLVDNAIKFTPAGGSVSLAVVLDSEGGMEITVEDTGIGIDAKNLARVLRPFARVATPLTDNTGGAGLGLPIVARLAELHDAKLNMTSEPGQGTRARFLASIPMP